jgi:hypothetical protein
MKIIVLTMLFSCGIFGPRNFVTFVIQLVSLLVLLLFDPCLALSSAQFNSKLTVFRASFYSHLVYLGWFFAYTLNHLLLMVSLSVYSISFHFWFSDHVSCFVLFKRGSYFVSFRCRLVAVCIPDRQFPSCFRNQWEVAVVAFCSGNCGLRPFKFDD